MSEQEINTLVQAEPKSPEQELVVEDNAHPALQGIAKLSLARQIGLMLALAFSVAIGVAVVLWSQTPSYSLLMTNVAEKDAAEILEILDKQGVDYKVETGSAAIMVPTDDVRELKMKLAALGLPRSNSLGYELLDKETGFGTSKSAEALRFQRALEGEIARTITSIQNIKSARVLLAMPKQSVFIRKRKKPSASVIVKLYQGRSLEKNQIQSIVHLVASSVPLLEPEQVTVVDQKGRLLNTKDSSDDMYLTSKQFEYKKQIEDHLMARINNILSPVVGMDGLRVQVSADVDFTVTEKTQEMFNPDLPALRSEQVQEQQSSLSAIQGVPGALSNQPPPAGVAPEIAIGQEASANAKTPQSASKSAVRNFELDKTITHTRMATGQLRRLSVAVVIDNQRIYGEAGEVINRPYSQEDVNRFTDLVKQAIGYDVSRGDQVTVSNVTFMTPETMEALPEIPLWEQGWFIDLMKQLAAVVVVLLLIFAVLRPAMRILIGKDPEEIKALEDDSVQYDENGIPIATPADDGEEDDIQSMETEDLLLLEAPQSYEKRLEYVRKLVDEDPKLVATVIKTWVAENG
jgi:flagellar M-ring protein FliF